MTSCPVWIWASGQIPWCLNRVVFFYFFAGSAFDFSNVLRRDSYLGFVTDSVHRVSDKQFLMNFHEFFFSSTLEINVTIIMFICVFLMIDIYLCMCVTLY